MKRTALPALLAVALVGCGDESTGPGDVGGLAIVSGSHFALLGRPLPVHPVVELRSRGGDPLEIAGIVITATVSAGSLAGTTSVETDSRGRAAFADLAVDGEEGEVELRFSCCGTAAASLSLNLELGEVSIHRLAATALRGQAGQVPPSVPRVRVDDERGRPMAGTAVQFSTLRRGYQFDTLVTTDAEGTASYAAPLDETPGTLPLTATHVASGLSLDFELTGETYGTTTVVRDDTLRVAAVGDPIQLPRLHVTLDGAPVTGAKVRYRVVFGEGVLSADSAQTTDGSHDPVTITSGGRGLTVVEFFAVGYTGVRTEAFVWVVPPVELAFPDPCTAGCPAFDFTVPANVDVDVPFPIHVRDAVGPVPGFQIRVTEHGEAGVLWVDNPAFPYELLPNSPVAGGSGEVVFFWQVPRTPGAYSFTLSGQTIAEPWTFTATRSGE